MAEKYFAEWKGMRGSTYRASISVSGYSGQPKELTLSKKAFVMNEVDDDDPLTTMRSMNGKLYVYCDSDTAFDLTPTDNLSHKLTVSRGYQDYNANIFHGYITAGPIQCDVLGTEYSEIEIIAEDCISSLKYAQFPDDAYYGMHNLAKILRDGLGAISLAHTWYFMHGVDLTARVLSSELYGNNYYDILSNMLKMQGLSIHSFGDVIFMHDNSSAGSYNRYSQSNINTIANGGTASPTTFDASYQGSLLNLFTELSTDSEQYAVTHKKYFQVKFDNDPVKNEDFEVDKTAVTGDLYFVSLVQDGKERVRGYKATSTQRDIKYFGGAITPVVGLVQFFNDPIDGVGNEKYEPSPVIILDKTLRRRVEIILPFTNAGNFGFLIKGKIRRHEDNGENPTLKVSYFIRKNGNTGEVKILLPVMYDREKKELTPVFPSQDYDGKSDYTPNISEDDATGGYFRRVGTTYESSELVLRLELNSDEMADWVFLQDLTVKIVESKSFNDRIQNDMDARNFHAESKISSSEIEEIELPYTPDKNYRGSYDSRGPVSRRPTLYEFVHLKSYRGVGSLVDKNYSLFNSWGYLDIFLPGFKVTDAESFPTRNFICQSIGFDTISEKGNVKLRRI